MVNTLISWISCFTAELGQKPAIHCLSLSRLQDHGFKCTMLTSQIHASMCNRTKIYVSWWASSDGTSRFLSVFVPFHAYWTLPWCCSCCAVPPTVAGGELWRRERCLWRAPHTGWDPGQRQQGQLWVKHTLFCMLMNPHENADMFLNVYYVCSQQTHRSNIPALFVFWFTEVSFASSWSGVSFKTWS